jgi:hypothetical protein
LALKLLISLLANKLITLSHLERVQKYNSSNQEGLSLILKIILFKYPKHKKGLTLAPQPFYSSSKQRKNYQISILRNDLIAFN